MSDTKKCKYCQSEIDKKAKICPVCKKKQGGGKLKWIIIGVVAVIIIGAIASSQGNSDNSTTTAKNSADEKNIEYTKYDVSELMDDLETNALKASDKYKGQYVEITGKLYNIDSSGKYIDLCPTNDDFSIIGVQCYIKNNEQKEKIKEMEIGQTVTLKGKITDVGEVLGYFLDITEIE